MIVLLSLLRPRAREQLRESAALRHRQCREVSPIHESPELRDDDAVLLLTHKAAHGRSSDNNTFMKGLFRPFKADSPLTYVFPKAI